MRRWLAVMLLVCGATVSYAGEPSTRLVQVDVAREGEQVVCRLQTRGLPGARQLQSMRSGLTSAVELSLFLVDANDQPVTGRVVSLRLGFDLWDEVFSVRGDGRERRFHALSDLQDYLADLRDLPVTSSTALDSLARYRLQVDLVVHPVAEDEQQRVADAIAGEQRRYREGQDQQEASVSLGRLIRLFYKNDEPGQGQRLFSAWFTRRELPDATH